MKYYDHDNGNLMWLTLGHHGIKIQGDLGFEWHVDRTNRLVINDITGEKYSIPDNICVT